MNNCGIIKLHYNCNNNCLFCHAARLKEATVPPGSLQQKIRHAYKMGLDGLFFSGGEPTIHPAFFPLAAYLHSYRLGGGLITNGRMLAYEKFVKRLLQYGFRTFFISLHSADPGIHDALTRCPGSWRQVVQGLRNLKAAGDALDITVNCVLTRINLAAPTALFSLLQELGINRLRFTLPEIKGELLHNPALIPHLDKAATFVNQALESAAGFGITCGYDGFARCLIHPSRQAMQNDLESNSIHFMSEGVEQKFYYTRGSANRKTGQCLTCSHEPVCGGYYNGYAPEQSQPRPVTTLLPDHIPFFHIGSFPIPAEPCLIKNSTAWAGSAFNRLVLRQEHEYLVYAAGDTFFRNLQIRQVKNNRLYMEADGRGIAAQRKLQLIAMCTGCSLRCPRIYQASGRYGFFQFNAAMLQELEQLAGNVLEVGFGDLYLKQWLFEKPAITYFGIDPDCEKTARARQSFPGREFACLTLENFQDRQNFFDTALLGGSYNHLQHLEKALANLRLLLKTGGRILIFESALRGILKQHSAVPAPAGAASYAHYRNHTLEQAAQMLVIAGFTIVSKQEEKTGGLWMLAGQKV